LTTNTTIQTIKAGDFKRLLVLEPKRNLQQAFADQFSRFSAIRRQQQARKAHLEALFGSLLHRAFSGALTSSWREAHMKDLLREMERHAKALTAPARLD
jgi:type I restriction enzyme S subunit